VVRDTEPYTQPVPVPAASVTCSSVLSTLPVTASTLTVSRLGPPARVPSTVVCQASLAAAPRSASTTSRVPSTLRTEVSCLRAVAWAARPEIFGVTDRAPIALVWATEVYRTTPPASVITTKSPPWTARPW
jgi:hypothetical protein